MQRENTDVKRLRRFQVLSELISRSQLLSRVGKQFDNSRDIYEALGYLTSPSFLDYKERYIRQDIAKRINNAPVAATWRDRFRIVENADVETEFERDWKSLVKRLKLISVFSRLDRLVGFGEYAILLCGYSDVKSSADFANPVQLSSSDDLLYVQPYSIDNCTIDRYVEDIQDARYGLPRLYRVNMSAFGVTMQTEVLVHHDRVIHVAEDLLENSVKGQPRLQVVLNRLFDLEKIVGGSAEMFWRGARPGYAVIADADTDMEGAAAEGTLADAFQDELDEFEHNLRRWLRLQGAKVQALAPQIENPKDHVDVQLQMISAATGIPKRILVGSERGELSSQQDEKAWKERIEERRVDYAEDQIIRPFIDKQIKYGILSPLVKEEYEVQWPSLWEQGEKEKAEVGRIRTEALARYSDSISASSIVSPSFYLQEFLGLSVEEIAVLEEKFGNDVLEEEE